MSRPEPPLRGMLSKSSITSVATLCAVALLSLHHPQGAAATGSSGGGGESYMESDPRCADVVCGADGPFPPGFTSDPTTCAYGECPRCLVGSEWAARLAEIGAGRAPRDFVPTITFDNWLSGELTETIFRILAEEAAGYRVRPAPMFPTGYDVLCCQHDLIALEKWPSRAMPNDEGTFSLSELPVGYEGGSGLFVPRHTVDRFPLATSYNAYKYLPDYQNIFPRGYSTPCEEALIDPDAGCVAGNFHCDTEVWPNTTCAELGRYVPPQCEADPTGCQEIYMAAPTWDMGFFEGLIRNTGLKFVVVYLGGSGMPAKVRADHAAGKDFMFYWWEPDPLVALVQGRAVVFDPPTFACRQGQNTDPTLSTGDCDYGRESLTKLARRSSLAKDSDFKFLFDSFRLSGTDMNMMLGQHTSAGGDLQVYNVSCNWVRDNFGTWKDWVRNTQVNDTVGGGGDSGAGDRTTVIAVAVSLVGVAALAGVVVFAVMRVRAARAVQHAPRKPPMAIVFTDVENSTNLWERYGKDMGASIEEHNRIIRECIEEFNMYEVKIVGDAFVIAGASLVDAAMCCIAIQTRLMEAQWPESVRYWKEGGDAGLYCGLRVRMGLHLATDIEAKFDAVYGRYDYFGPDMNCSARVESAAAGGQILMTAETYAALVEDPEFAALLGDDAAIIKFCSGLELKGVATPVTLYSMTPAALRARFFDPIPGAVDELMNVVSASDTVSMSQASQISQSSAKVILRVLTHVFEMLPSRKERDVLLSTLLTSRSQTQARGAPFVRRLKLLASVVDSELGSLGFGGNTTAVVPLGQSGVLSNPGDISQMDLSISGKDSSAVFQRRGTNHAGHL